MLRARLKNGAGIDKDVSLKNLRKTYITWVNQAMGNETGLLTSHSTQQVLERYYLDPKVLSAIERGALEIKVFGVNNNQEMDSNMTEKEIRIVWGMPTRDKMSAGYDKIMIYEAGGTTYYLYMKGKKLVKLSQL
jgi:hypothetical protein